MRKLLLSIVILLSLSACNKESADIVNVPAQSGVPVESDTNASFELSLKNMTGEQLYALLQTAAKQGDLEKVRMLIKHGADVNMLIVDKTRNADVGEIYAQYQDTPLMLASKQGHVEVVKALLGVGANVNQTLPVHPERCLIPGENETALVMACTPANIEVVKLLAAAGTDAQSVVLCACWINSEELLQTALKEKPDLNFTTGDGGITPLYYAVEHGYENMVKTLLEAGADPKYPEEDNSMLQAAKDYPNIMKLLEAYDSKE